MKGKILVIEDDKFWQKTLREYLEDASYFVDIVDNLESAVSKVRGELYHFITIDMQLNEDNTEAINFEGWTILEIIEKLKIEKRTPAMVITGFDLEYESLKEKNEIKSLYFMGKGTFDRDEFIKIIDKAVKDINLHFFNDHRDF